MTNSKNMHLTIRRKVGGISRPMEDFGVLWVWKFCGNSHGFFFCGNGMGMGIVPTAVLATCSNFGMKYDFQQN